MIVFVKCGDVHYALPMYAVSRRFGGYKFDLKVINDYLLSREARRIKLLIDTRCNVLYGMRCDLSKQKITNSLSETRLHNTIRYLKLDDNFIDDLSNVILPIDLRVLSCQRNQLTNISNINFPDSVTELYLNNNNITSLRNVKWPRYLRSLGLDGNHMSFDSLHDVSFPDTLEFISITVEIDARTLLKQINWPPSLIGVRLNGYGLGRRELWDYQ
eukprot:142400_1